MLKKKFLFSFSEMEYGKFPGAVLFCLAPKRGKGLKRKEKEEQVRKQFVLQNRKRGTSASTSHLFTEAQRSFFPKKKLAQRVVKRSTNARRHEEKALVSCSHHCWAYSYCWA